LFPPPFHLYLIPPNRHRRGDYGRRWAVSSPTTSLAASPVYLVAIHIPHTPSTYLSLSTFQSPLSNPNHRRIWAIAEYLPLDLQRRRQGFTAPGLLPVWRPQWWQQGGNALRNLHRKKVMHLQCSQFQFSLVFNITMNNNLSINVSSSIFGFQLLFCSPLRS